MTIEEVQQYLAKKNLTYTHPSYVDIWRPLKFIAFPYGRLFFEKSQGDDILQIADEQGIPYAVAILTYYFASNIEAFYDDEYGRDYSALTITNTRTAGLSAEVLDNFFDADLATLHRVPEAHKDGAIVGCPEYTYLFFKEFEYFGEIELDIAYCQGLKETKILKNSKFN